jgi:hypothetical protein
MDCKKEDTGISARCLPEGRKCAASLDGVNYLFYRTDQNSLIQMTRNPFTPTSQSAAVVKFLQSFLQMNWPIIAIGVMIRVTTCH